MNPSRRTLPQRVNDQQRGFSMVELMIAITISLLLLAGVIQIFSASRQTYTLQDGMSRLQENARYALGRITQDISSAGYLGCMDSSYPDSIDNNLTDQGQSFNFEEAIYGLNDSGVDGTDILTVRFGSSGGIPLTDTFNEVSTTLSIDGTNPNYDQLKQFDIMTVGNCDGVSVFMITNDPTSSGGNIEFQAGVVAANGQSNDSDFDSPSFAPDAGSYPLAFKVSSASYLVGPSFSGNGNALFINSIDQDNELIQGVEDFQVLFGVNNDNDLGADRYVDADNVGGANWNDVVSVRLTLRLNTVDPVQAGATIAKVFTTTVRLRNRGETT